MANDTKWNSPTGSSISSHETDKLIPEDKKLNLPDEVTIYQSDLGGVGKLNMFVAPMSGEYIERTYIAMDKAFKHEEGDCVICGKWGSNLMSNTQVATEYYDHSLGGLKLIHNSCLALMVREKLNVGT